MYDQWYREPLDYLVGYFVPGFDKNLVNGRCVALLASGRQALVPASVQKGDLIIVLHLTGEHKRGPYIARQRDDLQGSTHSSVIKENFLSTVKSVGILRMINMTHVKQE